MLLKNCRFKLTLGRYGLTGNNNKLIIDAKLILSKMQKLLKIIPTDKKNI